MVNTLWNTPEKVTTTANRSWSGMLKKIVAWAIALTLSGQPAEAKTFEKQEFPTEMVANVPWEISPMTENIEQNSIPNYINQAKVGVRKYYPKYENYFNNIFNDIKGWSYEEYLINKEIKKNLVVSWDLLNNDKEIITTILISIEKILSKDLFRTQIWINENSDIYSIANDIEEWFFNKYSKFWKNIKNFWIEFKSLTQKMDNYWEDKIWNEYISLSEKYMPLLKERLLDYGHIKKSKDLQEWIKTYSEILNKINKKPSQIWQKYIIEYNKIKN